mgnify:CR=1 FL=1
MMSTFYVSMILKGGLAALFKYKLKLKEHIKIITET